jgi:hypothetical protein
MPTQPDASHATPTALPYSQLPPAYHRWKWQVLLAYAGFYLMAATRVLCSILISFVKA